MENNVMKAWQLHQFNLNNLTFDTIPIPVPADNQVLIQVKAVSLNYRDKAIIDGFYDPEILKKGALILGSDTVGKIIQTGKLVTRFKVGDRIITNFNSEWIDGARRSNENDFNFGGPLPGGLAEYMVLHENAAVSCPSYLSDEEASTLPVAALTAWFALKNAGGDLLPGQSLLVQRSGGVSIFAIQIAHAIGAKVIAITSNDDKAQRLRELGADQTVNYTTYPAWNNVVLNITEDKGVDQILEIGGGEKSLNQSIAALKPDGLITLIGFMESPVAKVDIFPILLKQVRIHGIAVGHRKAFEEMNTFFELYRIKPLIDTIYPLENAMDAFRHYVKGSFGKIVISIP